jgi:hypothetical protein
MHDDDDYGVGFGFGSLMASWARMMASMLRGCCVVYIHRIDAMSEMLQAFLRVQFSQARHRRSYRHFCQVRATRGQKHSTSALLHPTSCDNIKQREQRWT